MGILIALFVLLFLLLLVSMPLIVEARMRLGVRGAVVHGKVYILGLVPIPVRLRMHLMQTPYFTLIIGKKQIPLLQKRPKPERPRLSGVRILRLDTRTAVGIEDEPADAVLIAGSIAVLLSMLTTRVANGGSASAALCSSPLFRITAYAQAILFPPKLFYGAVLAPRIARRKAANNIRKTNEKRRTYASC